MIELAILSTLCLFALGGFLAEFLERRELTKSKESKVPDTQQSAAAKAHLIDKSDPESPAFVKLQCSQCEKSWHFSLFQDATFRKMAHHHIKRHWLGILEGYESASTEYIRQQMLKPGLSRQILGVSQPLQQQTGAADMLEELARMQVEKIEQPSKQRVEQMVEQMEQDFLRGSLVDGGSFNTQESYDYVFDSSRKKK